MKAFNIEAENSQHIIDAVNEVSNHFAVSSSDLSNNLGKVSAALAVNGVQYEEMLGMMTAITEVTRNASTASRGLNMISSRLVQTLDESSSTGKKLVKIYNDLGIALKDEKGQMRGTYDILKDLANQWNKLSGDQQKYIALTSAGARQTQNFVALMENFGQAIKATEMAYESSGSAAEENARVMDSVEKKMEVLRSEFQQIVIGKGGLQDFAKGLLDIGTSALKLINSLGGLSSVLIVLTGVLISLNLNNIINGFTKLSSKIIGIGSSISSGINAWKNYIASLKLTKGEITAVEVETASLSATMKASLPIIGLIVTALSLVTAGIVAHNQKLEEQKQKIRDNISAFADEYKALDNASERLKDENISREELNSIIDSNLDQYDSEVLKLLDVNDAREKTIDLIEQEKKARAQELVDTGLTEYEDTLKEMQEGYGLVDDGLRDLQDTFFAFKHTSDSQLDDLGKRFKEIGTSTILASQGQGAEKELEGLIKYKNLLITERNKYDKSIKEEADAWEYWNTAIKQVESPIINITEKIKTSTEIIDKFESALKILGIRYDKTTGQLQEGAERWGTTLEVQRNALQKSNVETKRTIEELQELKKQYNITENAIEEYIETHQDEVLTYEEAANALIDEAMAQEELGNSVEDLDKAYEDVLSASNSLVSSINEVSSALKEQAENGSLSVETQLKLIEAGYATALMYDKETGACKLNEKAVQALVEAKIEMQIANLEIQRSNIASKLIEEANAAIVSAGAFLELAKAKNLANQAALDYSGKSGGRNIADPSKSTSGYGGNFGYLAIDSKKATDQIDALNAEIDALQSSLGNIKTKGVGAFGGISKGAGGAKKETKELNKELEETKKKYETVIKWISKQYDKEIDKIKKAKDEAIKAEEAKIKAKEKEKDKALDAIEKEIKALEKEKDARKKYWDERIDALKKQNEATKDALELQEKLDALEKARNTKVKIYKEGQGFVYDVDQTAVAKAQKELDEYLSEKAYEDELERLENLRDAEMDNYEQRIDAMNEYKDKVQENYEAQIAAMNEHKEQLEAQYDAEIELYENYKQQFEDMVNAYEEEQNRLLAQQLTGIDFENKNWMTRLDNLAAFVNEYNKLQKQLDTGNTSVSNGANLKSGGGLPSSSGSPKTSSSTSTPQYDSRGFRLNEGYTSNNGQVSKLNVAYVPTSVASKIGGSSGRIYTHASGIGSINSDEIAVVGENPNKEIVIGSKINNGELMNLGKGTGVVNADSSKTLAGMLNQVGQFGASGFGSGNGTLNNNINNDSLVVNGVTIQGANIKDPETFVNGLLNLKAEALQRAYRHR